MTNPSSESTGQKRRRSHSKEFKEQAVSLARKPEMGFQRAAHDLGIGESLLRKWAELSATEGSEAFRGHGVRTDTDSAIATNRGVRKIGKDALRRRSITDALSGTGVITILSRRVRLCYPANKVG